MSTDPIDLFPEDEKATPKGGADVLGDLNPVDDSSDEHVLGRPKSLFKAYELKYIDEEMKSYFDILEGNPRLRPFVHEAIYALVQMIRMDKKISDASDEDECRRLDRERGKLNDRYMELLEKLGLMPKADAEDMSKESLATIHKRYIEQVRSYADSKKAIGRPGKEALALAKDRDVETKRLKGDVVPSKIRDAVIEDSPDG